MAESLRIHGVVHASGGFFILSTHRLLGLRKKLPRCSHLLSALWKKLPRYPHLLSALWKKLPRCSHLLLPLWQKLPRGSHLLLPLWKKLPRGSHLLLALWQKLPSVSNAQSMACACLILCSISLRRGARKGSVAISPRTCRKSACRSLSGQSAP